MTSSFGLSPLPTMCGRYSLGLQVTLVMLSCDCKSNFYYSVLKYNKSEAGAMFA
jgi:hypothetical protein